MRPGHIFKKTTSFAIGAGVVMSSVVVKADVDPQLQQQRVQVLAAAKKGAAGLTTLIAAMKNPNAMIRVAAVRSMGEIGAPAQSVLTIALKSDTDPLVRRTALRALTQTTSTDNLAVLESAMSDSSALVRGCSAGDCRFASPHITNHSTA